MESFRKAYGALKDSTTVGLAKVNSEFKDLDIAIVKATNHVEYPPKERHVRRSDPLYTNSNALMEIGKSFGDYFILPLQALPAWVHPKAGGFDKLLLDSLYEDNSARRQLQLHNAGYGYEMTAHNAAFDQLHDPFAMSNSIAPPANVQMALMSQQEHIMMMNQQQMMQQQQNNMMMVPHNGYAAHYYQQQQQQMGTSNPFGNPFSHPQSTLQHNGNHMLI